ncbi:hypothetical protein Tco_1072553 [Tanacetum coccineum]
MERFKNAIFKQQEEINDKMAEMFGIFKELTTRKEERNGDNDVATSGNIKKPSGTETRRPVNEAKNVIKNEPIRNAKKEEKTEAPSSQPVEYYLKHKISKKLIEGIVDNHRPVEMDIRLSLASHSYIYPLGIAEDVLVKVAEHVYPVDFVILDIEENEKRPFILLTPFLTTAKAVIKFDKGTDDIK